METEEFVAYLINRAADSVAFVNPYGVATGDSRPTQDELYLAKVVAINVLHSLAQVASGTPGYAVEFDFEGLAEKIEHGPYTEVRD